MSYRGHVKNGVVVIDDAVRLPEGAAVAVDLVDGPVAMAEQEEGPTLLERLEPVIGIATGLPPDASTNVEHYLYGHPRR